MPVGSLVRRPTRNLVILVRAVWKFAKARAFLRDLAADIDERFDAVHFNHIGLWLVAAYLRSRTHKAFVMHIRTRPEPNAFTRFQSRLVSRVCDHLVFITENEEKHFRSLGGAAPGTVVFNVTAPVHGPLPPVEGILADRFRVACLSNFSWDRGVDRLADIADVLAAEGRSDIVFVVAGNMELAGAGPLPGRLGKLKRQGLTFPDFIRERGLEGMFVFLGHISDPERVYVSCDIVIKPSREEAGPWGRDIIEGMSHGKPVITVGTWNRFVETGVTGFLQRDFDPVAMAHEICRLADSPEVCRALGRNARARIADLCDPECRARELQMVWLRAVRDHVEDNNLRASLTLSTK